MAAHDPSLWETLQDFSQNLAIWTSRRMLLQETGNEKIVSLVSKALDFASTKDGKDSNFKLKTDQKSIIENVVCQKKDVLGVLPLGFGKQEPMGACGKPFVFHFLRAI